MGMFDYLKIDIGKLPITDEEKKLLGDNPKWQTKDFECTLNLVEITDDNKLRYRVFNKEYLDSTTELFANIGVPSDKHGDWHYENYHGFIYFYTFGISDKDWFEYEAKFTDGIMTQIKRVNF